MKSHSHTPKTKRRQKMIFFILILIRGSSIPLKGKTRLRWQRILKNAKLYSKLINSSSNNKLSIKYLSKLIMLLLYSQESKIFKKFFFLTTHLSLTKYPFSPTLQLKRAVFLLILLIIPGESSILIHKIGKLIQ